MKGVGSVGVISTGKRQFNYKTAIRDLSRLTLPQKMGIGLAAAGYIFGVLDELDLVQIGKMSDGGHMGVGSGAW